MLRLRSRKQVIAVEGRVADLNPQKDEEYSECGGPNSLDDS